MAGIGCIREEAEVEARLDVCLDVWVDVCPEVWHGVSSESATVSPT